MCRKEEGHVILRSENGRKYIERKTENHVERHMNVIAQIYMESLGLKVKDTMDRIR